MSANEGVCKCKQTFEFCLGRFPPFSYVLLGGNILVIMSIFLLLSHTSNFQKLCEDDTPMVRRAASGKLGVSIFVMQKEKAIHLSLMTTYMYSHSCMIFYH